MGKSEQRKGSRAEREVVNILRERGYDAHRGGSLTFGELPDVYGLPHVHIEIKRRESVNLTAALRQAAADADRFADGLPIVLHRYSREKWQVTMALDDWLRLYEASTLCEK